MTLNRLEITSREPFEDGRDFAGRGPFERITAIAHYSVDPAHEYNRDIVDLNKAICDDSGLVHFHGDVIFLTPADPTRPSRSVLLEVPNRGRPAFISPAAEYLVKRGCSIASCGWQWDVPRSTERIGFEAPIVPDERVDADAGMQLRLQPNTDCSDIPLTDQHVGEIGNHEPIIPVNLEDSDATLMVRDNMYGPATTITRNDWCFAHDDNGKPVADAESIWLANGFEAGRIYDLIFRPKTCRVVGTGLLAIRDFAVYLKSNDAGSPVIGQVDHVIGTGTSQTGRFLRTFIHFGLNLDEHQSQALDGALINIAGGRRGEFNQRYGQPSVQATPNFGHLFPFADQPMKDPHSGMTAGLLDRQRERGGVPRIFQTDTSTDYWRGDAGLAHIDANSGDDVEPPEEVRRYLFASAPHVGESVILSDKSMIGTRGANYCNMIAWTPFAQAALVNLLEWVRGTEPPPSVFPRQKDGTATSRETVLAKIERITDLTIPDRTLLPNLVPLDLGPGMQMGVGSYPAVIAGEPYPCIVSDVDENGNETGGIRIPHVEFPIGTHTGFNPRHTETGGNGQILEYIGSTWPFPRDRIIDTYGTRDGYLEAIRRAAENLVAERYLLEEDVITCIDLAASSWDTIIDPRDD
ncbi:MAG TPA: alpha/beta hydrolase domain-containing protein [Arenicellales bacterium]|jgi:hypothetical protein|nr:hypothetical protein [Nitrospinota bacterium]MDP6025071.1 alpha/beta hydrolase domain-containing protein [Pseudomonadales bacterium]MDP7451271.1 alpha/beta hydrolase domain-containing protein [Arenicellales bacterium]HJL51311.1 alpha/beta hydrolase domain-containing protein [Arenicellales bacterium]HJP50399.1 alpha/beta hydrolase domain-containing protein [Pseudomonadales bacterium]|tara:strand:- start:9076 stop:10980 length:1905 start_codon:yes stop_codon:yes gene_type:complete